MPTSFSGRAVLGAAAAISGFGFIAAAIAQCCNGANINSPVAESYWDAYSNIPVSGEAYPGNGCTLYVGAYDGTNGIVDGSFLTGGSTSANQMLFSYTLEVPLIQGLTKNPWPAGVKIAVGCGGITNSVVYVRTGSWT